MQKKYYWFFPILIIIFLVIGVSWLNRFMTPTMKELENKNDAPQLTHESFIMLADTGAASPQQFQVAEAVKSHCDQTKTCLAAFIAGDIIYEEGVTSVDDPQFQTKFEIPYQDIELPFYIAYGNHDYLGCPECYLQYPQKSTKWRMPARYYQQDFTAVSFFVIDTEQFDSDQQTWRRAALNNSTRPWKVVVGHRPLETYETTKIGENWYGKAELEEILCSETNLYVAGHAHLLEDNGTIGDCTVEQLVVGGGGAYHREAIPNNGSSFTSTSSGFVSLDITNQNLNITYISQDGLALFSRTKP